MRVEGVVQGVGFRPFVHALATRLELVGLVGNDVDGVFLEVEGIADQVEQFLVSLQREAPPLAAIERVVTKAVDPCGGTCFEIVASRGAGPRGTLVSADGATCADCLRELRDPADRRYRYPFTNCTNCGPRFTIVRDVPYDRPFTTMAGFPLCAHCSAEYHDPTDRRFHAQPVCCPDCGPTLNMSIEAAAAVLHQGGILAVKGLGGYHLAVDATNEPAAATLRARKHREDKPFAVLADLRQATRLVQVDEELLTSRRRPIVLLPRLPDANVAPSVAPGNRDLGVMLPYTPLHHLLLEEVGRPIVLTSGNVSDEPIAYRDDDAQERLGRIADAFLTHDRPIHIRTDDSVVRRFRDRELLLRRSRGYVPEPLTTATRFRRPVLACGAELKNTFCLAKDNHAFVSHHIGDLENFETLRSFTEGIEHFGRLFEITPMVVAHDLHPEYLSTKFAQEKYAPELSDVDLVGVQHHHAHIASCLADNGATGPVLGVAFDGTGYGTDGTIWGGEFLLAALATSHRLAHFEPVPMPGGAAAIKQPWRMAAAYLGEEAHGLDVRRRNESRWSDVVTMARGGVNSPLTSSAGRLFDAVAAAIDVRDTVNYEGQAAIELEQLADRHVEDGYRARIEYGRIHGGDLVRSAVDDLRQRVDRSVIAARFHNGVVDAIARMCVVLRDATGVDVVALSGGVFQNVLLLTRTVHALEHHGFHVLTHSRVPPNDGGISLGQAVVAGARDR